MLNIGGYSNRFKEKLNAGLGRAEETTELGTGWVRRGTL